MIGRFWSLGTGPMIILGGVVAVVTAASVAVADDFTWKDKERKQQQKPKS